MKYDESNYWRNPMRGMTMQERRRIRRRERRVGRRG